MGDRNLWSADKRPITAAHLSAHPSGTLLAIDGFTFERFERNGEMAPIPYLRAERGTFCLEAPLVHWDWVEFDESEATHDPR